MTNQAGSADKKHCFTSGLVEQLKARASVKRVARTQSSLSIFIWESPPLARVYKITFLARVEADGEEALGFRFDDVQSETPREIAWGGMVGTSDSPRCFLDGSQTFLTDSVSKASERCRRGWHVRIGKVSQILKMLENTQGSLAMKLSLRKLDSNTRVTDLVFRSPPSTTFENFYQDTLKYNQFKYGTPLVPSNSSSTVLPPTQTTLQPPQYSNPSTLPRQSKLVTVSTPFSRSSTISSSRQITQYVHKHSNPPTSSCSALSRQNTQSLPSMESLRRIQAVPPSMPMIPSTSSRTTPSSLQYPKDFIPPFPQVLPLTPPSPQCESAVPEAITPTFDPSNSLNQIEPSPLSPPPDINDSAATDSASKEDAPEQNRNSPETTTIAIENNSEKASDSKTALIEDSHNTSTQMVCFVFPPSTRRFNERKLYIPYDELNKVDYFKKALQSSNSTLSIDDRPAKSLPSFKTVKRAITAPLKYIAKKALELSCTCTMFLPEASSSFVSQNGEMITKLSIALSEIGLGLAQWTWNVYLEAMGLFFKKACRILDSLPHQSAVDSEETQASIFVKLLAILRTGLKLFCEAGLTVQQYLTEAEDSWEDDSDDELESLFGQDGTVQAASGDLKATFTINHVGYPSFCALSSYLQHGAINFAPLRSSFAAQKALACKLSEDNLTSEIARDFPSERRKYIESRSLKVVKDGCSDPDLKLSPCSPKSVYILADRLQLTDLKALAHRQIIRGLSPLNIQRELKNPSIYNYKELLADYHSTAQSILAL